MQILNVNSNRKLFYRDTYMVLEHIHMRHMMDHTGKSNLFLGDAIAIDHDNNIYVQRPTVRGLFDVTTGYGFTSKEVETRKRKDAFWFRDDWVWLTQLQYINKPEDDSVLNQTIMGCKKRLRFVSE